MKIMTHMNKIAFVCKKFTTYYVANTKITFTLKRKKHFIYSKICPKIEYN